MASLIITDAKIAKKLKTEKDEIITNFSRKFIVDQKDLGMLSNMKDMLLGSISHKISV